MVGEARRLAGVSASTIRRMLEVTERAKREGKEVINLSVGEPDFNTDGAVVDRAYRAMKEGYTHYTPSTGIAELREAIAERYGVEAEEVMVTAGASEALLDVSLAYIEENSKVVVPTPNFLSYFTYVKICGARTVQVPTHRDGFQLDPDRLNEVMDRGVSLVFLNYPNNPTGAVIDKNTLRAVVEIAEDCNALVVSDEIYDQIYYDRKPYSLAGYENVVTVNGFSKCLAMTGWRIGFVIAREELLDPVLKVHQVNGVCAPAFAQKAVAEVLVDGTADRITGNMVNEFRKRRDFVYKSLKDVFDVVKPEGAFYIFPDVGTDGEAFAEELFNRTGVVVTPGGAFGGGSENYVRISYAASMEELEKGIGRIVRFAEERE